MLNDQNAVAWICNFYFYFYVIKAVYLHMVSVIVWFMGGVFFFSFFLLWWGVHLSVIVFILYHAGCIGNEVFDGFKAFRCDFKHD